MERLVITAIALAIPAFFYTWLVRSIDRYEKEPAGYLLAAFAWGAFPAVVFAIAAQLLFSVPVTLVFGHDTLENQLVQTAVGAPVTEEILKATAIAIVYYTRRREFDGWVDGIVYGAMAGFGFAYVENVLYLMGTTSWEEWGTLFVLRTVVFGGLHGFWSALVGIGFGIARYMRNPFFKSLAVTCGLVAAILGHLIHNAAVTLVEATSGTSFFVALLNYAILILLGILLWFTANIVDRDRMKTYLVDEVPATLSSDVYMALSRGGNLAVLGYDRRQRRKLIQASAELAQKKMQFAKMGDEEGNKAEILRLRERLQELVRR